MRPREAVFRSRLIDDTRPMQRRCKHVSSRGAAVSVAVICLLALGAAQAQREFRVFPSFEGASADAPLPPDYQVPGELVIGRVK